MSSKRESELATWSPTPTTWSALCGAKVLEFGVGTLAEVFFDGIRFRTLPVDSTPLFFFIFLFFFTASASALVADRELSCKTDC